MWNYECVNSGEDYLAHHGILGMKWGVRRYQNEDGTLTSAGKKRYGDAENEVSNYLNAKENYKKAVTKYGFASNNISTKMRAYYKLQSASKQLSYAKTDLKDAEYRKKLSEQKNKSKRQISLESEYMKNGFTKEEAELAAYKRVRTERAIAIAGGLTVAAVGAYVAYKHYDKVADRIIKGDTLLQNISTNSDKGVSDAFYASFGKHDNNRYLGAYGKTLQDRVNFGFGNGVYKTNIKIDGSGLRVASPKSASKILGNTMANDPSFSKNVEKMLDEWGNQPLGNAQKRVFEKARSSLNKGKVNDKVYEAVNIALVDHGKNGQELSSKFYQALKSAGYDAIRDVNDYKYSGYGTRNPLIVFNGAAKSSVSSITKLDSQKIGSQFIKEYKKIVAEQVVKAYAPYGAVEVGALLGGTVASNAVKEKRDMQYVREYRKEHPNSKLTNKEIIRNR